MTAMSIEGLSVLVHAADVSAQVYNIASAIAEMKRHNEIRRAHIFACQKHKRTLGRPARKRLLKAGYAQPRSDLGCDMTPLTYCIAIHPEIVEPHTALAAVLIRRDTPVTES